MRRTIKMMITGVFFFKKNVDKKKKRSKEIDQKPLHQKDMVLRYKKYLDLLKHYNAQLPYNEQVNALKGSTAKALNLPKKAKRKINNRKQTFRDWYEMMCSGAR